MTQRKLLNKRPDEKQFARGRALSLGSADKRIVTPNSSGAILDTPRKNSTALVFQRYSSSDPALPVSVSSGEQSSPRLSPVTEERKRKQSGSSPRRGLLISSKGSNPTAGNPRNPSPRSSNSSPRSGKNGGSPRISIFHLDGESRDEGSILPISRSVAAMLLHSALEKFCDFTDEKKHGIEQAEINKTNGLSFKFEGKFNGVTKEYIVVVTGNTGSGSMVYLCDRAMKLGDGFSGELYVAYDLQAEMKVAAKVLKNTAQDISSIRKEITNLNIAKRFGGLFLGEFNANTTYVIFMNFISGKTLFEHLYLTDRQLRNENPRYKDSADYYQQKLSIPYEKRLSLAIGAVKALQEIHSYKLIHRDISGDNLLIAEVGNNYEGSFIDLDVAINVGCDLIALPVIPQKNNLHSLPINSNAAYIRVAEQLYYINKDNKECEVIENFYIKLFDEKMLSADKARTLTSEELKQITTITGHMHKPPRVIGGLNVAYGYAPPEFFSVISPREKKITATFESDYYMLGAVLVDILSSQNLQKLFKEDFSAMMARENYFRTEMSIASLKAIASDIFQDQPMTVVATFNSTTQTIEDYIYGCFILPVLHTCLNDLLSADPLRRLKGSSLLELADHLSTLRANFITLVEALKSFIDGVTGIQAMGIELSAVVSVIRDFSPAVVDNLLHGLDESALVIQPASDIESMLTILKHQQEHEERRQVRRVNLYNSLNLLIKGSCKLKNEVQALALFQPLIEGLLPNGAEAYDFLKYLAKDVPAKQSKIIAKK